jgi:hypothetical protein
MKFSEAIEQMVDMQITLSREGPDGPGLFQRKYIRDQFNEAKAIVDEMYEAAIAHQSANTLGTPAAFDNSIDDGFTNPPHEVESQPDSRWTHDDASTWK